MPLPVRVLVNTLSVFKCFEVNILSYGPQNVSFLNAQFLFSATEDLVFNLDLSFEDVWFENVVKELTALQKCLLLVAEALISEP